MSTHKGWIGVDLDGTLAKYDGWKGVEHIGAPVDRMLKRTKTMLLNGKDVRIFTARVYSDGTPERDADVANARAAIEKWCELYVGQVLPITNVKDFAMVSLYDDRAIQVVPNTGDTMEDIIWRMQNPVKEVYSSRAG